MSKSKKFEITEKGLQELKDELKDRTTTIRRNLQDQLDVEINSSDISENSNYYRLQDEIASNDKRAEELEELIKNAVVVETNGANGKIDIGSTVILNINGKEITYSIVGATEADPTKNKISIDSPIGAALRGKKTGNQVEVKTPIGTQKYDIIKVS